MKKQLLIAVVGLIASSDACAMDQANKYMKRKRTHVVYSHGFGEYGKTSDDFDFLGNTNSAPVYPDAPGNLAKAVFYTKPAVHTLADHLHDQVITENNESIVLATRSCGAGTAINCLEKLVNYDPVYFQDSKIKSKEDADKIVAAVNNGAFIQTAPFLSLRKANAIAIPSTILAGITFTAATTAAYYYAPSAFEGSLDSDVARAGAVGAGAVAYSLLGDYAKNMYARGIVWGIVPRLTCNNFDPHHADPLESVEKLQGKITCPMLLHFHKEDRVLENPDRDTIKVYNALKSDKTHIIITDDAWHNGYSSQFQKELQDFKKKHLDGQGVGQQTTQPTVDELRRQIYPHDMRAVFARNKVLTGGVVFAGSALVYKSMLAKE